MPITTHEEEAERYGDAQHWKHVMDSLFVRAIEAAGFEPVKPAAAGSDLIHARIVGQLIEADLVLCDLSSHNPNVFFELGVRTSLDRPIALVKDEFLELPFDTSGINTYSYSSALNGWEMEKQIEGLSGHIAACAESCAGSNPLWQKFGLTLRAETPTTSETPAEAKLDLLTDEVRRLARGQSLLRNQLKHQPSESETLAHRRGAERELFLSSLNARLSDLMVLNHPKLAMSKSGDEVYVIDSSNEIPDDIRGEIFREGRRAGVEVTFTPF